jgi:chromosome segregation ATPase
MVRKALTRADDARAAGDEANARLLEALARDWAETGKDLGRANDAERTVFQNQSELNDADARVARAKAMLETLTQRKARAQAEVEQLAEMALTPATSSSASQHPVRPAPKGATKAPTKKAGSK